jgi:hypothetical protein
MASNQILDPSKRLRQIPNVGPAIAGDLLRLGIADPADLVAREGDELYDELCRIDGVRHDPCLRDVFAAAVDYARGGPPRPWWTYTPERKARDRAKGAAA